MNLQLLRPAEAVTAEELDARATTVVAIPDGASVPQRPPGVALHALVDAAGPVGGGLCRNVTGASATLAGTERALACPNNEVELRAQDARDHAATLLDVEGVLLDAPDAWYAAGPTGAGFCDRCEARLQAVVREEYGDEVVQVPILPGIAKAPDDTALFWREREASRLKAGVEHGARIARTIRDEARRERNLELKVGGRLVELSAASVLLATRLDYAIVTAVAPSPDRIDLGSYEILRAALTNRPVVALATSDLAADAAAVHQAARLASAVGADLALPPDAPATSHAELTAHRLFQREFRSHYRPPAALAEVLLLYSAASDHWSGGKHGARVRAFAEAMSRAAIQYRVVLQVPRGGSEPLVLAECGQLDEEDATRIDRRITEGAGALLSGRCRAADENGRRVSGPFGELSNGLNRIGAGSVIVLDTPADAPVDVLLPPLQKALDSLLGRGRRAVTVSRPSVLVKMFLEPDKKLDVHLVGRQFVGGAEQVKGLSVYLAGSAVSGARSGTLFSEGQPERKVALAAFGMGVQAVLPDFAGAAILSVTR